MTNFTQRLSLSVIGWKTLLEKMLITDMSFFHAVFLKNFFFVGGGGFKSHHCLVKGGVLFCKRMAEEF